MKWLRAQPSHNSEWTQGGGDELPAVPKAYRAAIEEGRLLVVSPVSQSIHRVDAQSADDFIPYEASIS